MAEADSVHIVIETENVIEAVRAHRLLWDPAHDLYTAKEARRRAWNDICRTLMPDWDKFDDLDQNDIERKVQQRWRTARDCFVKARAARLAPAPRATRRDKALRSYSHFDRLSFLEETLRTPGAVTVPREPRAGGAARRVRRHRRHRPDAQPAPAPFAADADDAEPGGGGGGADAEDADDDGTLSTFERRLLATLARTVAAATRGDSPLEPDDEDFFRSLAPMLSALDHSQKLVFRGRVLDELQRQYRERVEAYHYVSVSEQRPDDDEDEDEPLEDRKYRPPAPAPATAPAPPDYCAQ